MTDTRVALGSDRLPWLQDAPERPRGSARRFLAWGTAAILLVAAASYWLGMRSRLAEPESPAPMSDQRTVTTPLPEPQIRPPAQPIEILPAPEVEPTPAPEVRQVPTPAVRAVPASQKPEAARKSAKVTEKPAVAEKQAQKSTAEAEKAANTDEAAASKPTIRSGMAPASSLRLWPSRTTAGAHGRVVQIGAFGSRHQAKLGWRHMSRAYPGVKRLPAVVVETNNSKGRKFYRFQIGTTSQAHSEVLCQRMEKISFSCAVMGLPWRPKGVER